MIRFVLLFAFLSLLNSVSAQRRNTVLFSYSLYEEFSFSKQIQPTLNPDFTDISKVRWTGPDGTRYEELSRPHSGQISYLREAKTKTKYFASFAGYYSYPGAGDIRRSGQSMMNWHLSISGGLQKPLWSSARGKLQMDGYARGTIRYGKDTYWMNYIGWVDIFPYRKLRDLGASAGINLLWYLPYNFVLSAEAGLTKWVFLYSNVFQRDELDIYYPLKPGNQLDMKVGLGFTFGKKINE